jgi:uncharacterized RDD family membrane protein YckC
MRPESIDQIEVEQTFYKRERDIFGNAERVPYKKKIKRKVEIVESGRRFGYFIIDSIFLYIIQIVLTFLLLFLTENLPPVARSILLQVVSLIAWYGYYFLFELYMQQTPGKMILGYVVINNRAQDPAAGKIALRTICRLIPFEAFSCLSEKGGWHDRFSGTYVVSKDERTKLQRLMGGVAEMENDLLDQ